MGPGRGKAQAALTGHAGWVGSVAVTADGKTAVSPAARTGQCEVWDLTAGRQQATLTGHTGPVRSVAITADGKTAVTVGGQDGTVRVWDLATRAQVARWDGDYPAVECTALPVRPLRIGVGQERSQPYLLELICQ